MIRKTIIALAIGMPVIPLLSVSAATLYVAPGGQHLSPFASWTTASTSITEAVRMAMDGDEVLVSNGFYAVTAPVIVNKGVSIRSVAGASNTIVHGSFTSACFQVTHRDAAVRGFTLTGGSGQMGGAAFVSEGGTIADCIVTGNTASLMGGGGIYLNLGGTVSNCLIAGNRALNDGDGGGVYLHRDGVLVDCEIRHNEARTGGGIAAFYYNRVESCTLEGNSAGQGGGVLISHRSGIKDSIVVSNFASAGGGLCGFLGGRVINTTIRDNTAIEDADTQLVESADNRTCFDADCATNPALAPEAGAVIYHVATNGNDAADGRSVTQAFRTIQRAIEILAPGNTVIISPGVYREYVMARGGGDPANGPVIRGGGTRATCVRGSDIVTNWIADGTNMWKLVNWPVSPQQLFAGGTTLVRFGWPNVYLQSNPATYTPPGTSIGQLTPGSFLYDVTGRVVYARFPGDRAPGGTDIEISSRVQVLDATAMTGVRIQNMEFAHANSFTHSPGGWTMLRLPDYAVVENSGIQLSDGVGIALRHNGTLRQSDIASNGLYGVFMETNNLVEYCRITHNTYRPFNPDWNSGGIRIIPPFCASGSGEAGGVIQHCEVAWNNGYGIWFDQCTGDVPRVVRNNYIHENSKAGIMFEISRGGEIYNNLVVSNRGGSIWISGSDQIRVRNNTLAFNEGWVDLYLHGVPRWLCDPGGQPVWASAVSNTIINNIMIGSRCQFDVGMLPESRTTSNRAFGNILDHNLYYRTNQIYAFSLAGIASYNTLSSWSIVTGWDTNSATTNPQLDQGLAPQPGSPCLDRAAPDDFPDADFSGIPRALDGDLTGGPQPDIGAYELVHPLADSDGDGARDAAELAAGTNPTDSNSVLRMQISAASNTPPDTLTWPGASDRLYRVSRTTNLFDPFEPWLTNIPAELPVTRTRLPPGTNASIFYRIELEP